jgi:predicted secreted protein
MNGYAIFAIYVLFWVISAFIVMPFGIRTPDETGDRVETGHADSAPVNFRPGIVVLRATILSAILFGLYYANYIEGWITAEQVANYFRVR